MIECVAGLLYASLLLILLRFTRKFKPNRAQLARAASSPGAAEGVLLGLWAALGLEEKGASFVRVGRDVVPVGGRLI